MPDLPARSSWRSTPRRCSGCGRASANPSPGSSTAVADGIPTSTSSGYGLSARAGASPRRAAARRRSGPGGGSRSRPAPCSGRGRASTIRRWSWWTGPVDVVHGTNFVVPPSRRAARLVTVHDLTPLRFPELCSPTSLRYPAPDPSGHRARRRPSTRSPRPWPTTSWITSTSEPIGCTSSTTGSPRCRAPLRTRRDGASLHPRHRHRRAAQGSARSGGGVRPDRRLRPRRPPQDRRTGRVG